MPRHLLFVGALLASATLLSVAGTGALGAQAPVASFELTVDSIMRGPKLVGYPPSGLRWSGDSRNLYFEWRRPGDDEAATYVVSRDGGEPHRLSDEDRRNAPPPRGVWDAARRRVLFVEAGDIVLVDAVALTRRQITRTTATETNPRWARKETHVTFVRDNTLFIVPLQGSDSGVVVQLVDVGPKEVDPQLTESQRFLQKEERELITHVREDAEKKEKEEQKQKQRQLPRFELGDRESVVDLALPPDEAYVYLLVRQRPHRARVVDVPTYITDSAYTEDITTRTNVGDRQERRRLAVLNLTTGEAVWADASFVGRRPEPRGGTTDGGNAAAAAAAERPADREVNWSMPRFSPDGQYAIASARAADNTDHWRVVIDPETGQTRVIDHQHDPAWVLGRNDDPSLGRASMGWMPDGHRIWFLSEREGWMHLFVVDVAATDITPTQLTAGRFEVSSAEISPDKQTFYFTSNEVHPGERHLYSMPIDGGIRTRITSMTGSNAAQVSPDETTLGLVFSYTNRPPEVFVMANQPRGAASQVTTTPTEEWRAFPWIDPQLVTFTARDGVAVYARLYIPEMLGTPRDPAAPGVIFVHGAGYRQNAHKYWSSYYREYMFHNLLAARGYVVLDVDYRASAGYGRDWRTAIYRHMGGKDVDDIVDGATYLVEQQEVDPRRIGVYGGSYGGFITLMAMFTSPDTFAAGAALRPVTDWAHYNHGYTSNILNEPQTDPVAYRRSSPIYFAEGLKGALLICHGMVDTNVHFQDSVRLVQRLIELRKENWELAVYPVENHGFAKETSWADEYRRIAKLFEENLRLSHEGQSP